jgi:putative hydrolase of the HAD superfamily
LADAYAGPRYASWLFPGTQAALQDLHDYGYRMGIIANTAWPGFSMDRAFAGVGLLTFFNIRLYSGDLGLEKPDPAIFRLAERIGGLEGKRILYVGNDPEKDVAGPAAVGWATALRRSDPAAAAGTADLEFDHIPELVRYCSDQ